MCYKSYVGCSTDFEKTIDELRKRDFGYVLQQISATWENASITPGRKRATKFLLTQGLQGLSGCRFQAPAVVLRLCPIRRSRAAKTKRTYVLQSVLHPRIKMCYKSSFPLVNRVLQKSAQIHAQKQRESASMGRGSGKGGGRVEKPRNIRGL